MKKNIALLFLFVLTTITCFAQTYEYVWAKRGGGIDFLNLGGEQFNNSETVRDIVVDSQDNYYFLCNMTTNSTDFDGNPILMADQGDRKDIVLVSTTCDGTFRWSKTFGSHATDHSEYMTIDNNDNLYIGCYLGVKNTVNKNDTRIDNDLVITSNLLNTDIGPHARLLYLVSYDNSGALRWIHQPEDTQADYSKLRRDIFAGIHMDSTGTLHTLLRLGEGTHLNGSIVVPPNNGTDLGQWFIIKYDNLGNYISHTLIPLDGLIFQDRPLMAYDETLDQYYISVSENSNNNINLSYNNIPANRQAMLLAIDATGVELWRETQLLQASTLRLSIGNLNVTSSGNLQVMLRGGIVNHQEEFAGFLFPTTISQDSFLAIITLDPNGNLIWGQNSSNLVTGYKNPTKDFNGITAVASAHVNSMNFAGLNYSGIQNALSDPVHFTLDTATGAGLSINSIEGNSGFNDGTTAVAFDSHGNMILGGFMRESLFLNHPTVPFISRSGGLTDLWVAKLAKTDCNGNPLSINDTNPKKLLRLQQNPVQEQLTVLGLEDRELTYKIYSVSGRLLKEGVLKNSQNSVNTSSFSNGTYFIQIYKEQGHETLKFVKE